MSRPKIEKNICNLPEYCTFKSEKKGRKETIIMTCEEYETIRLIDYENLQQEDCATRMNVSRTTVQFLYTSARNKMADFLVNGKNLEIKGCNYKLCEEKNISCGKGNCKKCNG